MLTGSKRIKPRLSSKTARLLQPGGTVIDERKNYAKSALISKAPIWFFAGVSFPLLVRKGRYIQGNLVPGAKPCTRPRDVWKDPFSKNLGAGTKLWFIPRVYCSWDKSPAVTKEKNSTNPKIRTWLCQQVHNNPNLVSRSHCLWLVHSSRRCHVISSLTQKPMPTQKLCFRASSLPPVVSVAFISTSCFISDCRAGTTLKGNLLGPIF